MAADDQQKKDNGTRLLSCYFQAANDGLDRDAIMLCEVSGEEIQTISLRVAADVMTRLLKRPNASID